MIDYDRALLSPASIFATPEDVIKEKSLSVRQKKEILYRWEHDAKLLQTAADENMGGGERANLGQVQEALRKIEGADDDPKTMATRFDDLAKLVSHWTGRQSAFWIAVLLILVWAITGPVFGFSDAWQLTVNTGTTIITFLMVFLIQSTQNRDTAAIHVKLDELVRATSGATNVLLDLEDLTEEKIENFRRNYRRVALEARKHPKLATQGADEGGTHQDAAKPKDTGKAA